MWYFWDEKWYSKHTWSRLWFNAVQTQDQRNSSFNSVELGRGPRSFEKLPGISVEIGRPPRLFTARPAAI